MNLYEVRSRMARTLREKSNIVNFRGMQKTAPHDPTLIPGSPEIREPHLGKKAEMIIEKK